jgi:hypothetical protein
MMKPVNCVFPVRRSMAAALFLALAVFAVPAPTQKANPPGRVLDGKAARELLSNRLWNLRPSSGALYYWTWKSDGSVCVRFEKDGKTCGDTGQWKLDGNRVCYELAWWGESMGFNKACFRIADRGKGRYAAIEDNDVHVFDFTVAR